MNENKTNISHLFIKNNENKFTTLLIDNLHKPINWLFALRISLDYAQGNLFDNPFELSNAGVYTVKRDQN